LSTSKKTKKKEKEKKKKKVGDRIVNQFKKLKKQKQLENNFGIHLSVR
jgi:hypothetical protein